MYFFLREHKVLFVMYYFKIYVRKQGDKMLDYSFRFGVVFAFNNDVIHINKNIDNGSTRFKNEHGRAVLDPRNPRCC